MKLSYFNAREYSTNELRDKSAEQLINYIIQNESEANTTSLIKKELEIIVPISSIKQYTYLIIKYI